LAGKLPHIWNGIIHFSSSPNIRTSLCSNMKGLKPHSPI
jgi:hypothetical protein